MSNARTTLDKFIQAKTSAGRSPKTLTWYADMLDEYVTFVEDHQLPYATPETVEAFQVHLRRRHLLPSTIDCYFRSLRAWYNWQIKRNIIAGPSPMDAVERPNVPRDPVDYVTLPEFQTLYASITGTDWLDWRDRCLLLLMYWSGLRVAEVTGLRVADLHLNDQTITVVRGKGGKTRVIPCAPELCAIFPIYLAARPYTGEVAFVGSDGYLGVRGPLTMEGVRQMLIRRCRAINMRHLHPHLFRHGGAMALLNKGRMQMSAVSAILGHANLQTTATIYARFDTDGLKGAYTAALAVMGTPANHPAFHAAPNPGA